MPLSPIDRLLGKTFEQPELTGLNRLPMRATYYPFPDKELALAGAREASPWWKPLDGTWRFLYRECPADLPEAVESMTTDADEWADIPVPGLWSMHGYSYPHYTNVKMPFAGEPPHAPERNPTGVYSRNFQLDPSWKGRRIVLHFGGVDGVLQLYLNGEFIGLNKDSRLPSEYDLSDRIDWTGENQITAIVIQYSDASYIEDQDQWRLGGIHREVYLYSTAAVYLEDIKVKADFEPETGEGIFDMQVRVGMPEELQKGWKLQWQVLDSDGTALMAPQAETVVTERASMVGWPRVGGEAQKTFERVRPWSAEEPARYRVSVSLLNPDGEVVESTAIWLGFRRVEIRGPELLVNGRAVRFNGVNRHDHSDLAGNVVSEQLIRKDLERMKAFNVNAIRCSHYPNDPVFYDLCDEYGFYVIDESNIEAHDFHNQICHDKRYLNAFVERGMRMVMRDKNHPCILMWSLGNESGYGANHDAMAGWIRGYDPGRILHYEGAISRGQSKLDWDHGHLATDVICPMYPSHQELVEWFENAEATRPLIMCEFSHAMGNSNGCLKEYFDLFEQYRGLQGGFIWEWVDHGLKQTAENGRDYWAYGGDFGESPHDANFVADGLVWPDRKAHPGLFEFKKLAQPLKAELKDADTPIVSVRSKLNFRTLDYLELRWELRGDGERLDGGSWPLDTIRPGEAADYDIPLDRARVDEFGGGLLGLHLSFVTKAKDGLLPAGHEVAWEHFSLKASPPVRRDELEAATARVEENDDSIRLEGTGLSLSWSRRSGELDFLGREGEEENILVSPLRFNWWRAATDNDGVKLWEGQDAKPLGRWRSAGLPDTVMTLVEHGVSEDGVVAADWKLSTPKHEQAGRFRQRFQLTASGLLISNELECGGDLPDLPRVGVSMALAKGFERVRYLGRGPVENYRDRCAATWTDLFETTVEAMHVPYIMPQENGNRTGIHWCAFRNESDLELRIEAVDTPFEFKASHLTDRDLFLGTHTHELEPRPETWVYLDHLQRGLGTLSCGPDTLDCYKIEPRRYEWHMLLRLDARA